MFRLFIKIDRIKNLTLISEAAPVDLDIDCRTPVSGRICDLLLYFRRVLNGIVLFFTCMFILDLKANFKSFINMINNTCSFKRCPCSEVIRFLHCLQSKFLNIISMYICYTKNPSQRKPLFIYIQEDMGKGLNYLFIVRFHCRLNRSRENWVPPPPASVREITGYIAKSRCTLCLEILNEYFHFSRQNIAQDLHFTMAPCPPSPSGTTSAVSRPSLL